jgi:hypothetical protein
VETDVIVAAELFGGLVVGNVGRSDTRGTLPIPAVSHVRIGLLFTGAACAVLLGSVLLAATSALPPEEPPPPQPTSAVAPSSEEAQSIASAEGRQDEFDDMEVSSLQSKPK